MDQTDRVEAVIAELETKNFLYCIQNSFPSAQHLSCYLSSMYEDQLGGPFNVGLT